MAWWKKRGAFWKLLGRPDPSSIDTNNPRLGDFYVATASESVARSEAALPGTASIPRLLTLVPPPLDPELRRPANNDRPRDYGPNPIAEYALAITASAAFPIAQLNPAITPELK